jgi:hypothetical protein
LAFVARCERHGKEHLRGVALLPPSRGAVQSLIRGERRVVQELVERLGGDAESVIGDVRGEVALATDYLDADLGGYPRSLGRVERVVYELLD